MRPMSAVLFALVLALTACSQSSARPTPSPNGTLSAKATHAVHASARRLPAPAPKRQPTAALITTSPRTQESVSSGAIRHVIVVWLENREYGGVTSTSMPYLTSLARQYGLATNYDAVSHPSEPNYFAWWSGSTQGITEDGVYNESAASLSTQFQNAGLSWRTFAQNYPSLSGCHTGSSYSGGVDGWGVSGTYTRKHDPAMSFTQKGAANCANIRPLAAFNPNVNLAFVVPNLCNDAHDCSLTTADKFLKAFSPQVFNASDWAHTLYIVTFDEGTTSTGGGGWRTSSACAVWRAAAPRLP